MNALTTYLQEGLKDNRVFRWPDKLMPLKIYVAPFRWYQPSKQQEGSLYNYFVAEALQIWSEATGGIFTYNIVNNYHDSNINITWRRVNRKSLGLCHINGTKNYMMYSAEVEIGISDGLIHQAYQDTNEVKHTIIHEMGHAIGLPHSPNPDDIMYVPHRYGVVNISYRDANSARWLYSLEPGFDPSPYMEDWGLEPASSLDDLIWVYENQDQLMQQEIEAASGMQTQPPAISPEEAITGQQDLLAYKNLYNMSLQHIKVDLSSKKPAPKPKTKNNNLFTTDKKDKSKMSGKKNIFNKNNGSFNS